MVPAVGGSDVGDIIAHIRSYDGANELPEDSRQSLLQAAKELQYNLETPKETCLRYRYSALDLTLSYVFYQIKLYEILIKHADSSVTTDDLATITSTDPVLLGRLLRFAASIGLVKQHSEDAWTASRLTHSMVAPSSQANLEEAFIGALPLCVDLPRFLAQTKYQNPTDSRQTVQNLTYSTDLHHFDWMTKVCPEHYEVLNKFMAANRMAKPGIDSFPFEDKVPHLVPKSDQENKGDPTTALFVDIGGGRGQMSRVFRSRYPHLPGRVVFQDIPQTLAGATPGEGIEAMAHDFFNPQPIKGAKIYFMRHVLHDWPDAEAEAILKRTAEAMDKASVLLIDEKVLPDVGTSTAAAGLDLVMMMTYSAQERTLRNWNALLGRAGLRLEYMDRYYEDGGDSVLMAVPVEGEPDGIDGTGNEGGK